MSVRSLSRLFLLIICSAVLTIACTDEQLVESERLERQLIITWLALEKGDQEVSKAFNEKAQSNWTRLRADLTTMPLTKSDKHSIGLMNIWMMGLNNAIKEDMPKRAIMNLTLMQQELRTVRYQSGMFHPADGLYDFYYSWQEVTEASNDQMLCLLEWKEYEEIVEQATKQWEHFYVAKPRYFDGIFPGFGTQSSLAENKGLLLTQRLEDFKTLLDRADHTLAAEPSKEIRAMFFDYLTVIVEYPETTVPVDF